MPKPRLLFMGTPEFAVPALKELVRSGYPVIGVVTQPDRPRGRGRRETAPPPVKIAAEGLGLKVFQPARAGDAAFLETFRALAPELVVVAAFGQILPEEILYGPRLGCINIHPSLLPKYRGAAPINWALIRGEQKTGVTIMRMDDGVDTGDILLQEETPILPEENYGILHDRLANMGSELLLIALAMLQTGTFQPRRQDGSLATYAPRLTKEDGLIRWDAGAQDIVCLIRGLSPLPCAYTFLAGRKLKILAAAAEGAAAAGKPGTAAGETAAGLRVAARDGYVLLKEVQLEGRNRLSCGEFLRGCRIAPGQVLG